MDIKEFAKSISGKEYGYPQFIKEEIETAKENGFVIVYREAENIVQFYGAIRDSGICKDGDKMFFNKYEICKQGDYETAYKNHVGVSWRNGTKDSRGNEIVWTCKTEIPHETFMIYEGGEPYCRGIVFSINDVK